MLLSFRVIVDHLQVPASIYQHLLL